MTGIWSILFMKIFLVQKRSSVTISGNLLNSECEFFHLELHIADQ